MSLTSVPSRLCDLARTPKDEPVNDMDFALFLISPEQHLRFGPSTRESKWILNFDHFSAETSIEIEMKSVFLPESDETIFNVLLINSHGDTFPNFIQRTADQPFGENSNGVRRPEGHGQQKVCDVYLVVFPIVLDHVDAETHVGLGQTNLPGLRDVCLCFQICERKQKF